MLPFLTNVSINTGSGIIIAILMACIAASKGRSALGWFLLGLIPAVNCVLLIVLVTLSDLRVQDEDVEDLSEETRLLNERLAQERMRGDRLRAQMSTRLDAHDRALGMDTRPDELPIGDVAAANLPPGEKPSWYYNENGSPAGPISRSALKTLYVNGVVDDDTLVWCDGMGDWTPFGQLAELAS